MSPSEMTVEQEEKITRRLAQRVRFLRQIKGWNQADLAQRAGVSRTTIFNLENSATAPTLRLLIGIAVGFDMPVHLLLAPLDQWRRYLARLTTLEYTEE